MSSFDGGSSLLFDTFVPISSIITITIVVGYTLPRNECFGLFWLLSWTIAVIISLKGSPSSSDDTSNNNSNNNNNNKHVTREEEEGGNGDCSVALLGMTEVMQWELTRQEMAQLDEIRLEAYPQAPTYYSSTGCPNSFGVVDHPTQSSCGLVEDVAWC
mmetsp:Transcript_16779/g.18783  ORF Transcript_16779/g.18783 Transcript_16779/m.18783 type:complete len:158 (-) Transcript_16779:252-725(-)